MSIFNSIKFELLILALITLSIFISFSSDLWFYSYFININEKVGNVFLKEFFTEIIINKEYVENSLGELIKSQDLSKFIL